MLLNDIKIKMFSKSNLSYFKNDIPSGLVVSLVALPLFWYCSGSEAEPFAGIISDYYGIVVTILGSVPGVSGPLGLITIVAAITDWL